MGYIIGVDTGGTFTDIVVLGEKGEVISSKASSTPKEFSLGVMNAVESAAKVLGISTSELLSRTSIFGHGTTVATNALITHNGSVTAHLTTKGFEDTMLIGRIHQKVAGLSEAEIMDAARLDKAEPLSPRNLIRGITERIDYKGAVVVPLNVEDTRKTIKNLVEEAGVKAIAVTLLWSFMNPTHEQEIKKLIKEMYPSIYVTISSDVAQKIKEYERMATTELNAYLGITTSNYLSALDDKLKKNGLKNPYMVMQIMGGFMSCKDAAESPILTLGSGPVGGAVGTEVLAKLLKYPNVISTDMGGTSFDVGLLVRGKTQFTNSSIFEKYTTLVPAVDLVSIGAGGGSIAWIEKETGLLKVGPRSAGADPAPVCYDRGGTEPAVTDANIVLNRYSTTSFLGGKMRINKPKAVAALKEKVADPLKMGVAEAAMGVIDIVDAHMADLIRKVTVGRGYDPRDFVLFAFGGASAAHVGAYGKDIGVKFAVIPYLASEFSAFGIAASDVIHVKERSEPMKFPPDLKKLGTIYKNLEKEIGAQFDADGQTGEVSLVHSIFLRYRGQVHELEVTIPRAELTSADSKNMVLDFEKAYEEKYGKGTAYKAAGLEAVMYRVRGVRKVVKPSLKAYKLTTPDSSAAIKETRDVYFKELGGFSPVKIFDRDKLKAGNVVEGPAVIEAVDTTVVVHPGQSVKIDKYLNMIMQLK